MKIVTYNLNGVRSSVSKGLVDFIKNTDADIYCFQEVRATAEVAESLLGFASGLSGYQLFVNSGLRAGYAGTAVLTRLVPDRVEYGLSEDEDSEGRTQVLYFPQFTLVNCYVPNGGSRLEYKLAFTRELTSRLMRLTKNGEVILCSDINPAHTEQDLSHPKECSLRSGFLPIEREAVSNMLDVGFCDALRCLHINEQLYTWRSYRSRIGSGWAGWKYRFDYVIVSNRIKEKIRSAEVVEAEYSDHLPIVVELDIPV